MELKNEFVVVGHGLSRDMGVSCTVNDVQKKKGVSETRGLPD